MKSDVVIIFAHDRHRSCHHSIKWFLILFGPPRREVSSRLDVVCNLDVYSTSEPHMQYVNSDDDRIRDLMTAPFNGGRPTHGEPVTYKYRPNY